MTPCSSCGGASRDARAAGHADYGAACGPGALRACDPSPLLASAAAPARRSAGTRTRRRRSEVVAMRPRSSARHCSVAAAEEGTGHGHLRQHQRAAQHDDVRPAGVRVGAAVQRVVAGVSLGESEAVHRWQKVDLLCKRLHAYQAVAGQACHPRGSGAVYGRSGSRSGAPQIARSHVGAGDADIQGKD